MEIKIFGAGCAKCEEATELIRSVVEEKGINADIEHVTDLMEMTKYDVISTPGIVIDGKVVSSGKVPTKTEVESWITGG